MGKERKRRITAEEQKRKCYEFKFKKENQQKSFPPNLVAGRKSWQSDSNYLAG